MTTVKTQRVGGHGSRLSINNIKYKILYNIVNHDTKSVPSADTDILILMLYNLKELESKGLNELWFPWFQAIGRCIPIHKLALKLGANFCKVIPAVHALTGCDYSSKAGEKAAALKPTLLCI